MARECPKAIESRFFTRPLAVLTVTVDQLTKDAQEPANAAPGTAKLVEELSSPEFSVREAAKTKLESAGTTVLPALRKAAESKDPEAAAACDNELHLLDGRAEYVR